MQPRERYTHHGPDHFGDAELIALILGTGTPQRKVGEIAASLLARYESLEGLARAHPQGLAEEPGVGPVRAIRLHAALTAGRRSLRNATPSLDAVDSSAAAWAHLGPGLDSKQDEELHALFLDRRLMPLAKRALTHGSDAYTVVDPRQIYREAVRLGASALVLAHNHPSGDPTPSPQDLEVTERVARAGAVLGITLVDHLICGKERWNSLRDSGHYSPPTRTGPVWTA